MANSTPYQYRERSRSRGRSISSVSSRSSSVGSAYRLNMDGNFPPVQRWNGQMREATDWNSLRRDPELWHPQGNCLVYLFERGASRRGPSFRIPYDFLLYSSCRPLIEHSMTAGLQTSLYHPGSTTPPSYDNLSDPLSHESSYCSLHLDAPLDMSTIERFNYHITTRNFFAWLVGAPLVGTDPVSALLDLKVRMDIWRDPGADNFGSLFQYVQEQSYGDFEDLEIQMGRRLDGETPRRPQPYRNVSQTLEQQEAEMKRGRRSSIHNFGQSIRSGSQKLRRKVSRAFSRTRGDSQTRRSQSPPTEPAPAAPTLRQDVHKIMQPQLRTRSPPRPQALPLFEAVPTNEDASSKPTRSRTRESSLVRFAKRRLSWAAGPLRSDSEPFEADSSMVDPTVAPTPPEQKTEGELTALPVQAGPSSQAHLTLQTHDLDGPAPTPNVPMRSTRRPLSTHSNSQLDSLNNTAFSPSSSSSNASPTLPTDLAICACCGKPRKADGIDPASVPLHAETTRHTRRGSAYSEISVANYGNGMIVGGTQSQTPIPLRRSSAQRSSHGQHSNRHSTSHSFVSRDSSLARERDVPGLEYSNGYHSGSAGTGTGSDSAGPVSPVSPHAYQHPSSIVGMGGKGRKSRLRRISNPTLVSVNGMVGSPVSPSSPIGFGRGVAYFPGAIPKQQEQKKEMTNDATAAGKREIERYSVSAESMGWTPDAEEYGLDGLGYAYGMPQEQGSGSDGSAESEVQRGKKRASGVGSGSGNPNASANGLRRSGSAAGMYHQAVTTPSPMETTQAEIDHGYGQSSGDEMIGLARGSGGMKLGMGMGFENGTRRTVESTA